MFLLESPEPIDFTEEVSLRLQQRVRIPDLTPPFEITEHIKQRISRRIGRNIRADESKLIWRRDNPGLRLNKIKQVIGPETKISPAEVKPSESVVHAVSINDVSVSKDRLTADLDVDKNDTLERSLVFVQVLEEQGERFYKVFRGEIKPRANRQREHVDARMTEILLAEEDEKSSVLPAGMESARSGSVFLLDKKLEHILDSYRYTYIYVDVDVKVLQDGTANRALIIPVSGSSHRQLSQSYYRLKFSLSKKRWITTDPADDINQYHSETTLSFSL